MLPGYAIISDEDFDILTRKLGPPYPPKTNMKNPKLGDQIFYVLGDAETKGRSKGELRPAIITRIWDESPTTSSCVQIQVFTDGQNDSLGNVEWRTSIHQSERAKPLEGTFVY